MVELIIWDVGDVSIDTFLGRPYFHLHGDAFHAISFHVVAPCRSSIGELGFLQRGDPVILLLQGKFTEGTFLLLAVICISCFFFTLVLVPETRGMAVNDVLLNLNGKTVRGMENNAGGAA